MKKRKVTQIVRGRNTVDGAGVHLRRILGEQTVHDFDPFLMLDGFDSTNPQDYINGYFPRICQTEHWTARYETI